MTTLKPCPKPWCNEALVLEVESKGSGGHRVVCHKCGDRSPWFATRDKLFEVWNHRPGEEAVAEECAKIVEEPSGEYSVGHRKLPYWDGEAKAAEIRKRFGGKA